MKRGSRPFTRTNAPVMQAAFAIFAVLINTIFTASLSFAATNLDPLQGNYVLCPASGGLMPAAPVNEAPGNSGEEELHCPLCRLPTPVAVQIPLPGDASVPNRIVIPVRYVGAAQAIYSFRVPSAFEARAPPR